MSLKAWSQIPPRPVRLDGDRRGYVIATGDTNLQALERAESAALLLYVETE